MTDQEINEAVARKLGWTDIHKEESLNYALVGKVHEVLALIPDYCHSISAAWEIMDKYRLALKSVSHQWHVTANVGCPSWIEEKTCECGTCEKGDTAPMAICKAFLLLDI